VAEQQQFNVREIADRIQRQHETTKTVIDRIRSWADYGLLEPVGDKHPGTGKKRRYGPATVVDAVVLTALTDLGLAAVRVGHFKGKDGQALLQIGRDGAFKVLTSDDSDEAAHFLIVVPPPPGSSEATSIAVSTRIAPHEPTDKLGIVGRPRPNVLIPPKAQGAIVLNLTDYFRPLRKVLTAHLDEQTGSPKFTLKDTMGAIDGEH
jgi:hypothetical protein